MKKRELRSWEVLRQEFYKDALLERHEYQTWALQSKNHEADLEKCKEDTVFWIKKWCWAYDPRNQGMEIGMQVPFYPTPHQVDYIDWVEWHIYSSQNGLTEKTRGEGMSWLWVLIALKNVLFNDGFKVGFGTYKEDKLDQIGNMDSLFEKLRYCYYRLPAHHKPKGFNPQRHDNFKRFYNPDNGSAITGEVGADIGRGGRNTVYFIDEHAHLLHAESVEKALSENTDCIMYGSTPKGTNNMFYQKAQTMEREHVYTFHWTTNPMKNEEWYDDRCMRFDPVTIAQEIDIDYTASVEGIVIPARWVQHAVDLQLKEFEDTTIRHAGVDVGQGSSKGESVYAERIGATLLPLMCEKTVEPTEWILRCADQARSKRVQVLKYDAIGVGGPMGGVLKKIEPPLKVQTVPVISGARPSDKKYDDNPELKASDRFANLRAEMWWNLRERFRKVYENATQGKNHPEDELISIPNDRELITQLSQPTIEYTATGKIKVESKEDMQERGISSPDRADAVVYCFADLRAKVITIPKGTR